MTFFDRRFAAALLAGVALVATPAIAQKKDAKAAAAPAPPKLSKPVAVALQEAQKLQQAGDNAGSLAKIAEAEAFPTPTPDDIYMTSALRLNAAIALKDNDAIEKSLSKMIATGKVSPENLPKFLRTVGSLALQRKDYQTATNAFEQLAKLDPNDSEAVISLAELYYAQKQSAKAVETISQAITMTKAAGQPAPESWYRRRLAIAYDGKQGPAIQASALDLVKAYPNPVNWRDAIIITRDSFPALDDQTELDFLRLQMTTGSLAGERDYVEYADTALTRGYPGEASAVVAEGIRKNVLVASKPLVVELKKTADGKVPSDRAALPGLEKDIKGNPKIALVTGDAYYGYADYAKAAGLYKQAIGAPTVDQGTANLRMGMALAKSGDKAGATKAFQAVTGGPREALAKYWLAYLNQPAA
jgi:tetratricopeptide (TPR) repeat protein